MKYAESQAYRLVGSTVEASPLGGGTNMSKKHFIKRIPVLLLAASLAHASGWTTVRKIAQVAVAATTAGDLATSWQAGNRGAVEVNPLCPGKFGMRQVVILGGITGAQIITSIVILRRNPNPGLNKAVAVADFAGAGLHGWMIQRNMSIRPLGGGKR